MYCVGAVRNSELIHEIYPDWRMYIWIDDTVPADIRVQLEQNGAIIRQPDKKTMPNGMFWRFLIADEPGVERYLVRDTDSRLNLRERVAVDTWIESGRDFHVMRDHPHHAMPIMGGMWGARARAIKGGMAKLIRNFAAQSIPYTRESAYGIDQTFLMRVIWPMAKRSVLQHDSCTRHRFPGSVPFPTGLLAGDWRFVGEVFDERDQPHPIHWQHRVNHMDFRTAA